MSETDDTGRRVWGWLLTVVGVLWLVTTGGCTLFSFWLIIGLSGAQGGLKTSADLGGLLVLVAIALAFMAPGIGLLWGGWVLLKRRK